MRIGIIGAGQLSRMLALSSLYMGFEFVFFAEKPTDSVKYLGDFFQGSYCDREALQRFAKHCDVITYENENIPFEAIEYLESIKPIYPGSSALKHTQDKLYEKKLFDKLSIPASPYLSIQNRAEAIEFGNQFGYPFFIKKRKHGYDGKGLTKIHSETEILGLDPSAFADSVCEKYVKFEREVSIIAANSIDGQRSYYDICENTHNDGILFQTVNRINDPFFPMAKKYIDSVIDDLKYVGCIAFEFFQSEGRLLANEIAPRVHNSGHWTIEGAYTSQFENHIRAITGLTLGDTASRCQASMFNIIGTFPDKENTLKSKLTTVHDYKKSPMPGRKLGHITKLMI